jgi:hypothetical protein
MSEQLRTAAQAALEALEEIMGDYDLGCGRVQARALRAALAEPQPEPVLPPQIPNDYARFLTPSALWEMYVSDDPAAPQAQQPDCERRPYGDLRNAKWLDPECYVEGACQSLKFKQAQQPQPEPVAEVYDTFGNTQDPTKCSGHVWLAPGYFPPRGTKLYAAPQTQQPLTDEQILSFGPGDPDAKWADEDQLYFARAIEAAHGIGGKP